MWPDKTETDHSHAIDLSTIKWLTLKKKKKNGYWSFLCWPAKREAIATCSKQNYKAKFRNAKGEPLEKKWLATLAATQCRQVVNFEALGSTFAQAK